MSEFDYEDEEQTESRNPLRARMKELEKEAAELRKQVADAAQAKRELAFVKAGIDPTDAAAKYFVKGYDGELDPDQIRQAAVEARLIAPPEPVNSPAEQTAWGRTNQVAAGAQTAPPPMDWERRIADASSPQEVEQILAEIRATQIS